MRDAATIAAATNASYTLVAADSGHTVECKVSATNKYGVGYMLASLPILA
jgi:hypothetical protein